MLDSNLSINPLEQVCIVMYVVFRYLLSVLPADVKFTHGANNVSLDHSTQVPPAPRNMIRIKLIDLVYLP